MAAQRLSQPPRRHVADVRLRLRRALRGDEPAPGARGGQRSAPDVDGRRLFRPCHPEPRTRRGISRRAEGDDHTARPVNVRDALGRTFDFPAPPRRVVSLVPSLTETLFDIGAGDAVVGVTDFCILPPQLDRLRLGGTKNPRVEAIRALAPDLVY